MNIIKELEDIRVDCLVKERILKEGKSESLTVSANAIEDIYAKLRTISWALKREIDPHAD